MKRIACLLAAAVVAFVPSFAQTVRDLWRQKDVGVFEGRFAAPVGRHGVVMVRVSRTH